MVSYLDKHLHIWEMENKRVVKAFNDVQEIVSCMVFHPIELSIIVTGSLDKIVRIWEIIEGRVIDMIQTDDYITTVAFDPEGKSLVVGFYHGICRIYKANEKFK